MVELIRKARGCLLGAATFLLTHEAFAQDAPVERPSVDHPAPPQPSEAQPEPVQRPATTHPAQASRSSSTISRGGARAANPRTHRGFLYLGAGLGLLSGLGGGKDFERSSPALTGLVGVELPLGGATGLGFELALDAELAGDSERGAYTAALLRARLAQMLSPKARLWGAVGVGRAGYESGALAGTAAVGSTLMLAPKFGLDLSANLDLVAASSRDGYQNAGDEYDGGLVLLIAIKALFELHPAR